ncbi:MAG TPA: hypothetical protein VKH19_16715 [Gemmatimonadaceae bacterium]|nr:hypothetical protein [Gemmatimonadaceae bacterium]
MGIVGLFGVIYAFIVWRRTTRTKIYKPVLEDWIWHVTLPLVAHVAVVVASSFTLTSSPYYSMFAYGAASLLLLFVGIHNAWDTTTYITTVYRDELSARATADPASAAPVSDAQAPTLSSTP